MHRNFNKLPYQEDTQISFYLVFLECEVMARWSQVSNLIFRSHTLSVDELLLQYVHFWSISHLHEEACAQSLPYVGVVAVRGKRCRCSLDVESEMWATSFEIQCNI